MLSVLCTSWTVQNLYIVRHRRHCLHCFVRVFPLLLLASPHKSVSVSSADHSEPQLQVQSVTPAAPVEGYLYPYY